MFIHRFGTLAQLLAYTKLNFFQNNEGWFSWFKKLGDLITSTNKAAQNEEPENNNTDKENALFEESRL